MKLAGIGDDDRGPNTSESMSDKSERHGLRWQAQRDTALARTEVLVYALALRPGDSAVAAALCRRTP